MRGLPYKWALGIATAVATLIAAAMISHAMGHDDPVYMVRAAIAPGALIAFAQLALAGPPLARLVTGKGPLDWPQAALLGMLIAALPAVIALGVLGPLRSVFGEALELRAWGVAVAALALSGIVGGLVFRALHGAGAR